MSQQSELTPALEAPKESHIKSLHVKNIRQFSELNISFNNKFNFIAGPNGCGKTSILACIAHSFSPENFEYSRILEGAELWTDFTHKGHPYRVGLGAGALNFKEYRTTRLRNWVKPLNYETGETLAPNNLGAVVPDFCPLFIGAHRNIKYRRIDGMLREEPLLQSQNRYKQLAIKSIYGEWQTDIKQWLVNRYFIFDKPWAKEEKANWQHLMTELPKLGPFDSDFRFVDIYKDLEPVFSVYGKECYLEELSLGFQAVLAIVANIVEWVEQTRLPGERIAKDSFGAVLIDELDLHLHPEWQFNLRRGLEDLFPNIQFIVTTHSPHLLASAKINEVIALPTKYDEVYNISPASTVFSGWTTDQILSEVMGVKSLENKDYQLMINKVIQDIESKNIEGLKRSINELEKISHPSDPIVSVFNTKLASMLMVQDD